MKARRKAARGSRLPRSPGGCARCVEIGKLGDKEPDNKEVTNSGGHTTSCRGLTGFRAGLSVDAVRFVRPFAVATLSVDAGVGWVG